MAGMKSGDSFYPLIKIAMIISVLLAVVVMGYIYLIDDDKYSALYLVPESYSGYLSADNISFVYGVSCFEGKKTTYNLKIYYDNSILKTDSIELNDKESVEKKEIIRLPENVEFPAKVSLVLENNGNRENVHFWLKN